MAKKFQAAVADSADIFDTLARGNTQDIQDTRDTQGAKPVYYRFNLKMPIEYQQYLQAAAYRASSPTKTVTITEYICELIRRDKEANE